MMVNVNTFFVALVIIGVLFLPHLFPGMLSDKVSDLLNYDAHTCTGASYHSYTMYYVKDVSEVGNDCVFLIGERTLVPVYISKYNRCQWINYHAFDGYLSGKKYQYWDEAVLYPSIEGCIVSHPEIYQDGKYWDASMKYVYGDVFTSVDDVSDDSQAQAVEDNPLSSESVFSFSDVRVFLSGLFSKIRSWFS